jgi:predicted DsbA family dithiol-disulfide isomerase
MRIFYLTIIILGFCATALGAQLPANDTVPQKNTITIPKKMTVEIWSDVMCPFCYIGKRKFEAALAQYPHRDSIEVVWRSFQLDPSLETDPSKTVAQSLSEKKGWSTEETTQMIDYVTNMARTVGLEYHFDKAVVANSYDAHRFTHYAKNKGKQLEAEEALFAAYFCNGQNTADHTVLAALGKSIGLDEQDLLRTLASDAYRAEVDADIETARKFGISGVPFFVFDRQSAISGAQDSGVFLRVLNGER